MTSTVFIIPGLGNSGEGHWQTLWEKQFNFTRIQQRDWETPRRTDWIDAMDKAIAPHDPAKVILVGHSLACAAIAFWSEQYKRKIKGALLVAPSDTEADTYPPGTSGFTPVPLAPLSFPSIVVASTNDYYVRFGRAQQFAKAWGSKLVDIGDAGHINVAAGFGAWEQGLGFLKELDR
jgi:predicted alpha/beta hydrolase family esterase